MLNAYYTSAFSRDVKKMKRKHEDKHIEDLKTVVRLVLADTAEAKAELRRRHRAHRLTGQWSGVLECHIGNSGDRLLIWQTEDGSAIFVRVGSHDELFS
ncbi:type II toxin-antitoxin system YafQ family toxin [Bifidobacterium sp. ESL0764]|uniref:type II toxin-antitoxin system RelE/ParE family toxin n=1 Tax=Bifidobacterium sp. ESL0764 TaxID=2983228 RepID=UPI0023F87098|nr:type II toxin-antitoxin system YafQ family toxin [Bifidobacterium sp. ESL0764]WEV65881.1 type II toxin-antitoxin system YafQ family toxin [Bifidobacterium sp. ESL0764]